jgi:O-antigen/teichoic acid export membrane protein
MGFQRTKNSARNIIFGVGYRIVSLVMPFAIRTIIVYKLGADYLGITSLFTSILTMLNMTELGFGSAVSFCMYKPVAEDDNNTICALINLLKKLYNLVGVITLIIGVILLPFLKFFIKTGYPENINIYLLYGIYLAQSVVSYLMYSYKNVLLEVHQRADIIHKINICVELVKYGVQVIILLLFEDYYLYALMLPLAQIITNLAVNFKANKMYPSLQPRGEISAEMKKTIRQKVMFLAAHSITSKFTNSVDNIVISASLGLLPIAMYGNYSYISSAVLAFVMIGYNAIVASVGNVIYTETIEKNRSIFKALAFFSWWGGTACTICLLCLYQPFMCLWLGKEYLLSNIAMIWCCVYFYVNSQRQFLTMVYISPAGLWNKTLLRQILVTFSNLVLDIFLVKKYGVSGIIFASVFTHAIIGLPLDIKVVYEDVLKQKARKGIIKILKDGITTAILCILTWGITFRLEGRNVGVFLVQLIIALVFPNILIILINYKKEEFLFIVNRVFRKRK